METSSQLMPMVDPKGKDGTPCSTHSPLGAFHDSWDLDRITRLTVYGNRAYFDALSGQRLKREMERGRNRVRERDGRLGNGAAPQD